VIRLLPFDLCRCLGHVDGQDCARRETCRRYLDRETGGPWTPTSDHLCDPRLNEWADYRPVGEQA
jgi:hypothetical protein